MSLVPQQSIDVYFINFSSTILPHFVLYYVGLFAKLNFILFLNDLTVQSINGNWIGFLFSLWTDRIRREGFLQKIQKNN
jgi:hypothetical protein